MVEPLFKRTGDLRRVSENGLPLFLCIRHREKALLEHRRIAIFCAQSRREPSPDTEHNSTIAWGVSFLLSCEKRFSRGGVASCFNI